MTAEYSAGSKLEKIFKSGQKAVTGECGPPRGADADHFRHKANFLKGCRRRGERHRQPDRGGAFLFHGRRQNPPGNGRGAGDADGHPGHEPHRPPEQHPGRRRHGDQEPAVPHRRPPVLRRPSPGQKRPRPGFRHAGPHRQEHAGRGQDDQRHRSGGPAQNVHRRRGQPLRRSPGVPGGAHGQEDQRRGPVHPDPVHL